MPVRVILGIAILGILGLMFYNRELISKEINSFWRITDPNASNKRMNPTATQPPLMKPRESVDINLKPSVPPAPTTALAKAEEIQKQKADAEKQVRELQSQLTAAVKSAEDELKTREKVLKSDRLKLIELQKQIPDSKNSQSSAKSTAPVSKDKRTIMSVKLKDAPGYTPDLEQAARAKLASKAPPKH